MIETKKPYGSIKDSEVSHLLLWRKQFYIVDNASNRYEVEKTTFDKLQLKGLKIKEVNN